MKDPEFIQLRNRFLFGALIVLVFAVPIIIFLVRTYGGSSVLNRINKKDTFTILVTTKDCDKCSLVDDILKDNNVKYVELDSFTNKDYKEIMRKLDIENKREEFPILIYVKDGKMYANLFSISTAENVTVFLKSHDLINSK